MRRGGLSARRYFSLPSARLCNLVGKTTAVIHLPPLLFHHQLPALRPSLPTPTLQPDQGKQTAYLPLRWKVYRYSRLLVLYRIIDSLISLKKELRYTAMSVQIPTRCFRDAKGSGDLSRPQLARQLISKLRSVECPRSR